MSVLIPLAATGTLGLATVVATHELAELVVILNGIRAGRRPTLPAASGLAATSGPAHPSPIAA